MENRIAAIRKQRGFTQEKLAEEMTNRLNGKGKVRASDLSMIENGKRTFSLKRLDLIADILGVKPGDLLYGSHVASNATNEEKEGA